MSYRKTLPPIPFAAVSALPLGEQHETARLNPVSKESPEKMEALYPVSAPTKTGHSPSLPSKNCMQWVVRVVLCLLLGLLFLEGFLGLELQVRQTRKFLDNVKELRREQREEGLKGNLRGDVGGTTKMKSGQGVGAGNGDKLKMSKEGKDDRKREVRANGNQFYVPPSAPVTIQAPQAPSFISTPSPSMGNHQLQQENLKLLRQNPSVGVSLQGPMNPSIHTSQQTRPDQILDQVPDQISSSTSTPVLFVDRTRNYLPTPQAPLHPTTFQPPNIEETPLDTSLPKNVTPTILPFHPSTTRPELNNPLNTFAGLHVPQIQQAKQLRTLLDTPPPISSEDLIKSEREYYEERYRISKYPELPFCLVVPTYNNAPKERYLRNIRSILQQEYSNYHVVVLDDHSEDNTGRLIQGVLQSQKILPQSRYKAIINTQRMRAMGNIRNAALNHCSPQEIFMIIDGDDELIGRQVLKLYNAVFQEKGVYFVYSNFLMGGGNVGFSRPFPESIMKRNDYRKYPFVTSHLRAFYTKLLINIAQKDLKDDSGEYLKAANDVAICLPILEQAHERVGYLPELTYFYNSATGLNNHQLRLGEQQGNERRVRARPAYKRVEGLKEKVEGG